ncbi:hypothetical protein [Bacillus sp. FJAT-27231]|uniref:hypothetical protein n=1 Tax=Bacillus sp. FJAT-27231 TaxID=1679168 RepID=UPI000AF2C0BF|nr:hypothetical protein [Bacillus sp. FJAT-27231]
MYKLLAFDLEHTLSDPELPMLREAGVAIRIGLEEADYTFSHIRDPVSFIKEQLIAS